MPGRSRCCHVLAPNCATGGPSGPPMLRFRPFSCPWQFPCLRRSTYWTLGAVLGFILLPKVHLLDPRRRFGVHSVVEGPPTGPSAPFGGSFCCRRSTYWTLGVVLGFILLSKVHSLDPRRRFGVHSVVEGPPTGPSAPFWGSFCCRRSTYWTLGATCGTSALAGNLLTIRCLWKILGAFGAEDFLYLATNQQLTNQLCQNSHPCDNWSVNA